MAYQHITDILNGICEEEKQRMKPKEEGELGRWERAVVTSDGVWHRHDHFSKNGSFIVKD